MRTPAPGALDAGALRGGRPPRAHRPRNWAIGGSNGGIRRRTPAREPGASALATRARRAHRGENGDAISSARFDARSSPRARRKTATRPARDLAFAGRGGIAPPMTQPRARSLGAVVAGEAFGLLGRCASRSRYLGAIGAVRAKRGWAVTVFDRGELWGVLNIESASRARTVKRDTRSGRCGPARRALACVWAFSGSTRTVGRATR